MLRFEQETDTDSGDITNISRNMLPPRVCGTINIANDRAAATSPTVMNLGLREALACSASSLSASTLCACSATSFRRASFSSNSSRRSDRDCSSAAAVSSADLLQHNAKSWITSEMYVFLSAQTICAAKRCHDKICSDAGRDVGTSKIIFYLPSFFAVFSKDSCCHKVPQNRTGTTIILYVGDATCGNNHVDVITTCTPVEGGQALVLRLHGRRGTLLPPA